MDKGVLVALGTARGQQFPILPEHGPGQLRCVDVRRPPADNGLARPADRLGKGPVAVQVDAVRVLVEDRGRDGVHERPQEVELILQAGRALAHLLFEAGGVVAVLLFDQPVAQAVFHGDEHLVVGERLGDVAVHAQVEHLPGLVDIVDHGDHDHPGFRVVRLDVMDQVDPGFPGHVPVGEHQVDRDLTQSLPGRGHVRHRQAGVAALLEDGGEQRPHRRLVVDHQDRGERHHPPGVHGPASTGVVSTRRRMASRSFCGTGLANSPRKPRSRACSPVRILV